MAWYTNDYYSTVLSFAPQPVILHWFHFVKSCVGEKHAWDEIQDVKN